MTDSIDEIIIGSKIKIRVKIDEPVIAEEVDRRELIFGNYEKLLYIKDLEDILWTFMPVDDTKQSTTTTWSSSKITDMIGFDLDVIDGGTF